MDGSERGPVILASGLSDIFTAARRKAERVDSVGPFRPSAGALGGGRCQGKDSNSFPGHSGQEARHGGSRPAAEARTRKLQVR